MPKKGRPPDLSSDEVKDIRRLYYDRKLKETPRTLAHLFRVSEATIHHVLNHSGAYKECC